MEEERNELETENTEETELNTAEGTMAEGKENSEDLPTEPIQQEEIKPLKADSLNGTFNTQNKVTDMSYFKPVTYEYDGIGNIEDEVEKARKVYLDKMKSSKILNIVSTVIMLISFVGVLLVVFLNNGENAKKWITYTVVGLALVLIVASFIVTSVFNKKDAKVIRAYVAEYQNILTGYVTYGLDVNDCVVCPDAKIDETDFIQAHLYRTISSIESRSVIDASRKGHHLRIAEMAAVVPQVSLDKANELPSEYINLDGTPYFAAPIEDTVDGTTELQSKDMTVVDLELADEANGTDGVKTKKKDSARAQRDNGKSVSRYGLFGRFYSYDSKVTSEESFIIYFLGKRESNRIPDYLTGYKACKIPGLRNNIIVFLADCSRSGKFFDEEAVSLLNDITTDIYVESAFLSVNSYGTKLGINLSNDVIDIPLKNRQTPGSLQSYKNFSDKMFKYIDFVSAKAKKENGDGSDEEN